MRHEGKNIPKFFCIVELGKNMHFMKSRSLCRSASDIDLKREAIYARAKRMRLYFLAPTRARIWQRAEDRNRGTADKYNQIGLPEFFALEAFTRWNGNEI